MRPKWWMAMLVMLQEAWSSRRDAQLRFLKVQVEMLQSRLPGNRVILSPAERQRLLKMGLEVDHAVEHTLAIVNIKTYRTWLRQERNGQQPRKVGRSAGIPAEARGHRRRSVPDANIRLLEPRDAGFDAAKRAPQGHATPGIWLSKRQTPVGS